MLFSPFTTFIYLPAIGSLADHYHRSVSDINLSVTTYQVVQATAPMLFADLGDRMGRRPIYIFTFLIYIVANIALALQNSYGALLGLRALQSAGASGVVALGNGVVADIVTSAERGGFVTWVQVGAQFAPAAAPVIGGILTQFLGWRSVFWFLLIASGIFLVIYIIWVPEVRVMSLHSRGCMF